MAKEREFQCEGKLESFNAKERKKDRKKELQYEGERKLVMPRKKSFNMRERKRKKERKIKMAKERETILVKGRQHAHPKDALQ
jgi:hypothetical protein